MKILISWMAYTHDFKTKDSGGFEINNDGPTFNFHKHFYNHDMHIILSGAKGDDSKSEFLINSLKREFTDRTNDIELIYLGIDDPIDVNVIKTKVEKLLISLKADEIDIFFSPGTSAMQLAWYICHTGLTLNTRLLQVRDGKFTRTKKPELLEIHTEKSIVPITAIIREEKLDTKKNSSDYLITKSLIPIYDRANKIAQADRVTTLITGDSGTGKEHLANYIHKQSIRKEKPFIAINCAAFTDQLLESRLFGYKKGSFTGADKDQQGLFQEVNGGTIFLDEIGDISPYMQQSLLRVFQEQEVLQLGSNKMTKIDVRIITATNKSLPELCKQEKFRWDLYYRLTVTELSLPSLLNRTLDEKQALINHFIKSKKLWFKRHKTITLSKEVIQVLTNYTFPGNIRELENLIEQLYVFNEGLVNVDDLPLRLIKLTEDHTLDWKSVEKQHIAKVLILTKGNKNRALKLLGYNSINTLSKKIKDYNIAIQHIS
jgi:transcriptional regulator with PAS, ATPase and Fis domain